VIYRHLTRGFSAAVAPVVPVVEADNENDNKTQGKEHL
jgi:hypothetical protein